MSYQRGRGDRIGRKKWVYHFQGSSATSQLFSWASSRTATVPVLLRAEHSGQLLLDEQRGSRKDEEAGTRVLTLAREGGVGGKRVGVPQQWVNCQSRLWVLTNNWGIRVRREKQGGCAPSTGTWVKKTNWPTQWSSMVPKQKVSYRIELCGDSFWRRLQWKTSSGKDSPKVVSIVWYPVCSSHCLPSQPS